MIECLGILFLKLDDIPPFLGNLLVLFFSALSALLWFKSSTIKNDKDIDFGDIDAQDTEDDIPDCCILWLNISSFWKAIKYCFSNFKTFNFNVSYFKTLKIIALYNATAAFCASLAIFFGIQIGALDFCKEYIFKGLPIVGLKNILCIVESIAFILCLIFHKNKNP